MELGDWIGIGATCFLVVAFAVFVFTFVWEARKRAKIYDEELRQAEAQTGILLAMADKVKKGGHNISMEYVGGLERRKEGRPN